MNIYIAAAIAFIFGVSIATLVARKLWLQVVTSDRLKCPTNRAEEMLRHAAFMQLREIDLGRFQLDTRDPANMIELLRCLGSFWDGALIGEKGVLRLPNGSQVRIGAACHKIEDLLMDSYKALDEAAGVILEYAETLPVGALEGEGQVLHSKKYAFESEIVHLALALGLDPDQNDVAKHGGEKLWQRWQVKIFPNRRAVNSQI
jgi:hypothetical protein